MYEPIDRVELAHVGGVDSAPAAGDKEGLLEVDLGVPVDVQRKVPSWIAELPLHNQIW